MDDGPEELLLTLRHNGDIVRAELVHSPVATRLRSSNELSHC